MDITHGFSLRYSITGCYPVPASSCSQTRPFHLVLGTARGFSADSSSLVTTSGLLRVKAPWEWA